MESGKGAGRFAAAILSRAFRCQPVLPPPSFRRWATLPLSPRRPFPLPARFVAGFSQRVSKGEVGLGLGMPTASALTNSASVIGAKDLTTAQPLGAVR